MNIFIGNLAASVTAENLRRMFDGYGTIINSLVIRDTTTGLPLGYGHVYLVPDEAAQKAIANLDGTIVHGSPVFIRECVYRARQERRMHRLPWQQSERRITGARRHNGYHSEPGIKQQQTG